MSRRMQLMEEIPLANGLVAEIWDQSRPIANDTIQAALLIRIMVDLEPSYFDSRENFELTRNVFGSAAFFEYRKERTFVRTEKYKAVFQEILDAFMRDALPYLSRPGFPSAFARSRYTAILKHPSKYFACPEAEETR